jgi:CBS domain-containing protein
MARALQVAAPKEAAMLCRDVMLSLVYRCSPHDTAVKCARLMRDQRIGFVPVVDRSGKPVGVVTYRDIAVRIVAEGKPLMTDVEKFMSFETLLTCRPDDELEQLETKMAQQRKSRAVVIDDAGTCVGVISLSDIAQRDAAGATPLLRAVARRESVQLIKM